MDFPVKVNWHFGNGLACQDLGYKKYPLIPDENGCCANLYDEWFACLLFRYWRAYKLGTLPFRIGLVDLKIGLGPFFWP